MCFAEGHAFFDEVVGDVGGEGVALAGGFAHARQVEFQCWEHGGEDLEGGDEDAAGGEVVAFVFLEIAVVGEWEPFEGGEDAGEFADEAAGAPASELGDVGVFLLGHDAGAGGEGIGEAEESVFGAGPEDDLFGEAGEVDLGHCGGEAELGDEVAVGGGVDGIAGDGFEAEFAGDHFAVEGVGGAGEGAGTERQDVGATAAIGEALAVAEEHFGVGEEVVAEGDGLGALEVGVAGHGVGGVAFGEVAHDADEVAQGGRGVVAEGADCHAVDEGDLVVAGACGVEAAGGLADLFAEEGFDVGMDVFEFGAPLDFAAAELFADVFESADDGVGVGGGDDALVSEHAGVGDGAGDIEFPEVAIEPGGVGLGELVHLALEAAAPGSAVSGHGRPPRGLTSGGAR